MEEAINFNQRLTRKQKEADDKTWYKHIINSIDKLSTNSNWAFNITENETSEIKKMQVNYDLFNNKINKSDFEKVCYPYGKSFELPADFTNKDIVSGKIKALLGMEMRRPFSWKILAVNKEATTRKEQEVFKLTQEFVINSIMLPIKTQIEQENAQQIKGKKLTTEENAKIQEQIAQDLKAKTPKEIKLYMERDHQDPAEVLMHQILEYLTYKEDIKPKFNLGAKHAAIAGKIINWVGIANKQPVLKVINPMHFSYDDTGELEYIEDSNWASYEISMSIAQIINMFGGELSPKELNELSKSYEQNTSMFDFSIHKNNTGIRVKHFEWKALKAIKFLKFYDVETEQIIEQIVDETYKFNSEAGDLEITTEWIFSKFEGYKVGADKFVLLREVLGQHKDLENLHECKLSYIGACCDNLNSETTSFMDRMKYYQYMYNVIFYRIELLIASDEGKALLLNANLIPNSAGLDIEKWLYYFKVNKIGLMNPNEEGNRGNHDITQAVKEVDMSLVSDIQKYIQLAEYIEKRCGQSIGITPTVEGQIGSQDAVRNTQQALIQSANILEPFFELLNNVKRHTLQALVECAKIAYTEFQPESLSYVLDDMSVRMLKIDYKLLEGSTYGLFVSNSMKSDEALQMMQQLSHAAMQNQKIEMSDVIRIFESNSVQEAGEMLKVAEKERIEREQQQQQQQIEAQAKSEENQKEFRREEWQHELNMMREQEKYKTERDVQKQAILSLGFSEDKDSDRDGTPDVLELAKFGVDADIKQKRLDLDKAKFEQQKKEHMDKTEMENKKIKNQTLKNTINNR